MTAVEMVTVEAPASRADRSEAAAAAALELVPVAIEAWDETAAHFDEVSQEQLVAFARLRWPGASLEPVAFRAGGNVVGGCLVLVQRLPLNLGAIAIAKWGPMVARLGRADRRETYAGMIEALIAEYAVRRGMFLSVLPWPTVDDHHPDYEFLVRRGFLPGSRLAYPDRYVVNLRLSDDAQRASLEQKWRYHLGKACKAGLVFERGGPERLPEFDALYAQMLGRKRFADHSAYDTVPALMATPVDELRPELFFVRHEGRVVAGAVIFKSGARAVYLYGATTDEALKLRAGYFLHWNIIRWLRDNTRADWYDLGGTDGFLGLHQFKKGMVGSAGVIRPVPRVANYAARRATLWFGLGAFALRELQQRMIRAINRLRPDRAKPDLPPHVERNPRGGL